MPSFYVRQVPKDNPVLRVLFHTANYHNIGHNSQICIVLTASMEASGSGGSHRKKDKRPKPSNSAKQGGSGRRGRQNRLSVSQICAFRREVKDGTCLGQLTLPSSWWMPFTQQLQKRPKKGRGQPSATGGDSGPEANSAADQGIMKQPKVFVDVKYSVFETRAGASCHQDQGHGKATTPLDGKSMHGLECAIQCSAGGRGIRGLHKTDKNQKNICIIYKACTSSVHQNTVLKGYDRIQISDI